MRRFQLVREGEVIAEGCVFSSGRGAIEFDRPGMGHFLTEFGNPELIEKVHAKVTGAEVVYLDPIPEQSTVSMIP